MTRNIFLGFLFILCERGFSQEALVTTKQFLPNALDSNNFICRLSLSALFPFDEITEFQKQRMDDRAIEGNRIFKGNMEMIYYPSTAYCHRLEPHFFFRAEAIPMQYVSSKLGVGVSDRKLSSSVGFFTGNYLRRVPEGGNFVTRRSRRFDDYPLYGVYLQTVREDVSLFVSVAFERRHLFWSSRIAGRMGHTLGFSQYRLREMEMVGVYESFTGLGFGFSTELLPGLRADVLSVIPQEDEINEQARLNYKLGRGVMVTLNLSIN